MSELLACAGLGKSFGGIQALNDVGFSIAPGEIYGLIGPNGAGKTTLFNVLTGIYTPDSGSLLFEGAQLAGLKPNDIVHRGIARTFQNSRLFANLSALENVMIGRHALTRASVVGAILRDAATRREETDTEARAHELLEFVSLDERADDAAGNLAYGDQRRLEIARAMATEPRLLALDEPAAGMNASETQSLSGLLRQIRARGITLLLIEHDMRLMMSLCDRILVLDHGEKIAEGPPTAIQSDARVIEAYLGAPATA